jgi:hypothetical protein
MRKNADPKDPFALALPRRNPARWSFSQAMDIEEGISPIERAALRFLKAGTPLEQRDKLFL